MRLPGRCETRPRRCLPTRVFHRRSSTRWWITCKACAKPFGKVTAESERARATEAQVKSMFDRIAGRYDLMNSVMSAGLHHRWRRRAADLARLAPGKSALDVCCG